MSYPNWQAGRLHQLVDRMDRTDATRKLERLLALAEYLECSEAEAELARRTRASARDKLQAAESITVRGQRWDPDRRSWVKATEQISLPGRRRAATVGTAVVRWGSNKESEDTP